MIKRIAITSLSLLIFITTSVTYACDFKIGQFGDPKEKIKIDPPPLFFSDEFGGHIVSGHVDGIGVVKSIEQDGESKCFWFEVLPSLLKYIAIKGSVAVDGVSLTVNEVNDTGFAVHIIPHTQSHTKLGTIAVEEPVNIEIDLLARYVARILERN